MARVVIIGGGVIGVLVAERINSVVDEVYIVEKDMLGSGTTGKSIANFATHISTDDVLSDLIQTSWSVYEPLVEEGELTFQNQGYLKVFDSESAFEREREDSIILRQNGVNVQILSPEDCGELGIVPETVSSGGVYFPDEGRLDPGNTPVAKKLSEEVLTLPMYGDLDLEDVDRICNIILK